jgi:endonuclease/exonuclease/phosphatase family metal-dependent hydrolase
LGRSVARINVHLGLLRIWRERQLSALIRRIERLVPHDAPLIIAGDFNDWTRRASDYLMRGLDVVEVFEQYGRSPARSFPAMLPFLHLDRIYARGFRVKDRSRASRPHWSRFSDHAARCLHCSCPKKSASPGRRARASQPPAAT